MSLSRLPLGPMGPMSRDVVEAALRVPILATTEGRDAALLLLRPELATAIRRNPVPRLDVISIVQTCCRYPGGLAELREAIAFLDQGTSALARLDEAISAIR